MLEPWLFVLFYLGIGKKAPPFSECKAVLTQYKWKEGFPRFCASLSFIFAPLSLKSR